MGIADLSYLAGRCAMGALCLLAIVRATGVLADRERHAANRRLAVLLLIALLLGGIVLSAFDAYDVLWGPGAGRITPADWAWFVFDLGVPMLALRVLRVARQRDEALARLWEMARTDPLTGLANRRGFEAQAVQAIGAARAAGQACTLLALDIDRFKAINDGFGHPAGDTVLRATAGVLAAGIRKRDLVGRIGGEEFVAMLPGLDLAEAVEVAYRLRAEVTRSVAHPAGGETRLTFSAGVALLSREGAPEEALERGLAAADEALYQAKRNGRDRVEVAPAPPAR
jgi:diguanylate cyclase (GGDEF)-like protein